MGCEALNGLGKRAGYCFAKLLIISDPRGARGIKTVNLTSLNDFSEKPREDSAKLVKLMSVTRSQQHATPRKELVAAGLMPASRYNADLPKFCLFPAPLHSQTPECVTCSPSFLNLSAFQCMPHA